MILFMGSVVIVAVIVITLLVAAFTVWTIRQPLPEDDG